MDVKKGMEALPQLPKITSQRVADALSREQKLEIINQIYAPEKLAAAQLATEANKAKLETSAPAKQMHKVTVAEVMETSAEPVPTLVGGLLNVGELALFVGSSCSGKSFLITELMMGVVKGRHEYKSVAPDGSTGNTMTFECTAGAQPVAILDLETDIDMQVRRFGKKRFALAMGQDLSYYKIDWDKEKPINTNESAKLTMEAAVKDGAKIIVIDNLSMFLPPEVEAEKSAHATKVMQELKHFARKHKITLVVVMHTPKGTSSRRQTQDTAAGSKRITDLADRVINVNVSQHDKSIRYIVCTKDKEQQPRWDSSNALTLKFDKSAGEMESRLLFMGTCDESELLKTPEELTNFTSKEGQQTFERQQVRMKVIAGDSVREIADALGHSTATIQRWRKELAAEAEQYLEEYRRGK